MQLLCRGLYTIHCRPIVVHSHNSRKEEKGQSDHLTILLYIRSTSEMLSIVGEQKCEGWLRLHACSVWVPPSPRGSHKQYTVYMRGRVGRCNPVDICTPSARATHVICYPYEIGDSCSWPGHCHTHIYSYHSITYCILSLVVDENH